MSKSQASFYLNKNILSWIDEKVKEQVYRNRSHAVEYTLLSLIKKVKTKNYNFGA